MPELPEVETVVRDLRPLSVGRTIRAVRQGERKLRRPWQPAWNALAIGNRIAAVRRRGKWIVVELANPQSATTERIGSESAIEDPRLIVHLGMTGQFTAVPAATPLLDHIHLVFELDDDSELRFRDIRRFGSATLIRGDRGVEAFFFESGLGPEPFGVDPDYFRSAVRRTVRNLKAILLDQTVLAGVGNIYADEACFRAKLHPSRTGQSLSDAECDRLREAIEAVLIQAVESRGSTIRDYIGGSGLRGGFQDEFAVYGRTEEPCNVCGTAVECVRLAGRSSHFCAKCQPRSAKRNERPSPSGPNPTGRALSQKPTVRKGKHPTKSKSPSQRSRASPTKD